MARRERSDGRVVVVQSQADLLEVVDALGASGRLACRLNGRQEQGDENGDDGDDYEEFNQRESSTPFGTHDDLQSFQETHRTRNPHNDESDAPT